MSVYIQVHVWGREWGETVWLAWRKETSHKHTLSLKLYTARHVHSHKQERIANQPPARHMAHTQPLVMPYLVPEDVSPPALGRCRGQLGPGRPRRSPSLALIVCSSAQQQTSEPKRAARSRATRVAPSSPPTDENAAITVIYNCLHVVDLASVPGLPGPRSRARFNYAHA